MLRSLIVTMCIALGATHAVAAAPAPQASQGQASTTRLVPHSGVLTDAAGNPLTGPHTVTFTLFDHPEGGTVLWTDTVPVTADDRGRYAVYLGAGQLLPLEHFRSEQARWVEASVNGHAGPRAMLVAVPYALKAADAETLGGQPVSSFLTTGPDGKVQRADGTALSGAALEGTAVDGSGVPGQLAKWSSGTTLSSSVITETGTNRIGVGLPDPTGAGVVDSVFTIKNLDNNTGFAILNETQQRRFAINTQADGGWLLYDGGSSTWNPGLFQRNGQVGIGTTSLAHKFAVLNTGNLSAGVVQLSNSGSGWPALQALTTGTGPGLRAANFAASGGTGIQIEVATTGANLIDAETANVNKFRVSGTGAVFAASYTIGGADFAEEIEPRDPSDRYEPGDVLVIGHDRNRTVARADRPYATTVIGIYSTEPGIIASPYSMDDPRRSGKLPVAMIGIVPCKISAENGPIERGDLLVTSSTPGHAMKATDRARMMGAIVGKALEPFVSGTGTILVAVTLQ